MAKEKENEFKNLESLDHLDMSAGFVCDTETGICGPADEVENKKSKEQKNESNHMV